MEHGKVKWFSQEKGYGFITSNSGEDYHFNVQSINGTNLPSNGDSVSFESTSGNKGKRALSVTITSRNQQSTNNSRPRNVDDRVNCPACNKKIVPRMITYRGEAQKSICPYCAATVKKFSGCFIATSVYGDPCCPEVRTLRKFRDEKLLTNVLGTIFVKVYYKISPPIADWLEGQEKLSAKIRGCLDYIVKHITSR